MLISILLCPYLSLEQQGIYIAVMSDEVYSNPNFGSFRWLQGLLIASIFSLAYILTPLYLLAGIVSFFVLHWKSALLFTAPIIISALVPPIASPWLVGQLTPLLDYFDFEEALEYTNDEIRADLKNGKKSIVAPVPHGVISFCGIASGPAAPPDLRKVHTAVANSVMHTPILKHVMGIYGLTNADKSSLQKRFTRSGIDGCIVLYVGGIAELFKSSRSEERLFLSKRKGFIKLALREGVDVVPVYLFGNTSVLTIFKSGPLASISRSLGVALTYFWGKWYLPIPCDDKCLYARGKPLGMPQILEPTNDDVDKWHQKYCEAIEGLFEKYKEKVPLYKHKKLYID